MIGINIQCPWAESLVNGNKCVETRSYQLPSKYEGEELAVIETPGNSGNFKARIIGTITFSHSFQYKDENEWREDYNRHLVSPDDSQYGWQNDKSKYGWVVSNVVKFPEPQPAPENKGIIFTLNCEVLYPSGV